MAAEDAKYLMVQKYAGEIDIDELVVDEDNHPELSLLYFMENKVEAMASQTASSMTDEYFHTWTRS